MNTRRPDVCHGIQLPLLPPALLRSVPLTADEWIRYFRAHHLFPGLSSAAIERHVPRANPGDIEPTYWLSDLFRQRTNLRLHANSGARLRAKWAERSLDHAYVSFVLHRRTPGGHVVREEYICPDARVDRIAQHLVELTGTFAIRRNGSSSIRKAIALNSERRILHQDHLMIVPKPLQRAA